MQFTLTLSSCVGCAPQYTYTYQVTQTSEDIRLLDQNITGPRRGILGGSKVYTFDFEWNQATDMPYVVIKETSLAGKSKILVYIWDETQQAFLPFQQPLST